MPSLLMSPTATLHGTAPAGNGESGAERKPHLPSPSSTLTVFAFQCPISVSGITISGAPSRLKSAVRNGISDPGPAGNFGPLRRLPLPSPGRSSTSPLPQLSITASSGSFRPQKCPTTTPCGCGRAVVTNGECGAGRKLPCPSPREQRQIRRLMVGDQQIGMAVAIEVSNPDIAGQVPGGKGRAGSFLKVALSVTKQHGHSAGFRIRNGDIRGAVMIEISDGYCIRIAAGRNHDGGKLRATEAFSLT